ncbi:MAG: Serine/threonine-protein kinase PK-1 [bacterium ADurb.Bin429]|nr:MAG: Serine/threonine-protein kinase PK-1 [bacterium ADurb.Bin429]
MRCLTCSADGLSAEITVCPQCGEHLPTLLYDTLPIGALLDGGRYRIDYALGRGGFGITYRAMHIELEHSVAIKEFYPKEIVYRDGLLVKARTPYSEKFIRDCIRFTREGKILARLNHPGIVRVMNHFEEHGTAYLVMELVRGRSLRDELNEAEGHRLSEERVREIMAELVEALAAVHAADLLHLDIKPENVILTSDGKPILVDFGAARRSISTGSSSTDRVFTYKYAPIELMKGDTLGVGSDIFQAGMLLHELLTGFLPPESWDRLLKQLDPWIPNLPEPWKGLVASALPLELVKRPSNIFTWWNEPNAAFSITSPVLLREQLLASIEWVNIPPGKFIYGDSPPFGRHVEISLPAYKIMKYPVTVAQYRLYCEATKRLMPEMPKWGWQDDHPIVNVSWEDAAAFAEWAGVALPTEEEWEKAARGTDGRKYPWGSTWNPSKCSHSVGRSTGHITPVRSYSVGASPYGVMNMAGNVWEWCANLYDDSQCLRALRGGSWLNKYPDIFCVTYRSSNNPTCGHDVYSFRCVSSSPAP